MDYQKELSAKLNAVRPTEEKEVASVVDTNTLETKILDELDQDFEFGQYDLDESDILRTLKILDILNHYGKLFEFKNALKVFYILCRLDVITAQHLLSYSKLPLAEFKQIINHMAHYKLVFKNESNELELTLEGKSLASRIGVDLYI
ncbi:MAG: hypothetical protein OEW60_00650 [Thiovulaceae bacterium]|nr:hypothetical protein [Sulfurimonadaceae bacterium]